MEIYYQDYNDAEHILQMYVASPPEAITQKTPTVLILHAWGGRDSFVEEQAMNLAEQGYIAIALDVYGKGILGHSTEEKSKLMMPFMEDRKLLRQRLIAGYNHALQIPNVDKEKISVIGYCFGGMCALEMACANLQLAGVISIHGLLKMPAPADIKINQKIKVLALHGDADPLVTNEDKDNFISIMRKFNIDWQINIYGQAKHAFTVQQENNEELGIVYNQKIAWRAQQAIYNFLQEIDQN